MRHRTIIAIIGMLLIGAPAAAAEETYRLVFGSFSIAEGAQRWAAEIARDVGVAASVVPFGPDGRRGYRVVTQALASDRLVAVTQRAQALGLTYWRLDDGAAKDAVAVTSEPAAAAATAESIDGSPPAVAAAGAADKEVGAGSGEPSSDASAAPEIDIDVGLQTRSYANRGAAGQGRMQPSASARLQFYQAWNTEHSSLRVIPFVRVDAEDPKRSHADLRELQFTQVGERWEVHAGIRQVFWGVTEFEHLVDVLNQTDLVENIDGEDKLGQPMIDVSLIREWGVVDLFVLPGFRERTFPGKDGRLRLAFPVDTRGARYESDDEQWHVDYAARWMHGIGPLEFGVSHFSGTSRAPDLLPTVLSDGRIVFTPYYPLINQTGLDAQAIVGDWLLKLEALTRSGNGERYFAATGGFEWTWVGALGSRADLGWVLEYLYDDRGDGATTSFEHDIAVGARWRRNDMADSQALLGVVWDHESNEYVVKLEGGRRLNDAWSLAIEGRLFGGGERLPEGPDAAVLEALLDSDNKLGSVQADDYLQFEVTRFF